MELFVYADSIVLILLPIQYGLLELMNIRYNSSSLLRKFLAALVGTFFFLLSFGGGNHYRLRTIFCVLTGNILMLRIAFPIKGFRTFLNTLEEYLKESILLGGILGLLLKILPLQRWGFWKTWGMVICVNIVLVLLCRRLKTKKIRRDSCKVVMLQGERKAELDAIIDTGNSLREPISGEPVSIVPAEILDYLWEKETPFRMVPFCSIAQKGMLKAYVLDELTINLNGHVTKYSKVYVAACNRSLKEKIHKMILNPALLKRG